MNSALRSVIGAYSAQLFCGGFEVQEGRHTNFEEILSPTMALVLREAPVVLGGNDMIVVAHSPYHIVVITKDEDDGYSVSEIPCGYADDGILEYMLDRHYPDGTSVECALVMELTGDGGCEIVFTDVGGELWRGSMTPEATVVPIAEDAVEVAA